MIDGMGLVGEGGMVVVCAAGGVVEDKFVTANTDISATPNVKT